MAERVLSDYHAKRDFRLTPEPAGAASSPGQGVTVDRDPLPRWVIQLHAARRLHYDLRLEAAGVLISWAVPRGPSYDPAVKRLAVHVEDHPLEYRNFEGIIPKGNYGAGSVIIWDEGVYRNLTNRSGRLVRVEKAVEGGHVSFWLEGTKLKGGWSLTRTGAGAHSWTLVKRKDEYADRSRDITAEAPLSVRSGKSVHNLGAPGKAGGPSVDQGDVTPASFMPPMLARAERAEP
ncbi:MAG TPA: DNA polymerase ligase N-terminal domain-containing protein, partial [Acidimicrobiales bacterium]|nr:DNA polymerase ligase N-terminal domain-containing protein [Acidimicrobiales bacterium]